MNDELKGIDEFQKEQLSKTVESLIDEAEERASSDKGIFANLDNRLMSRPQLYSDIMALIKARDTAIRIDERSRIDYYIERLNHWLEKNDIMETFEAMRNEYMEEIVEPHKRRLAELRGKGEVE